MKSRKSGTNGEKPRPGLRPVKSLGQNFLNDMNVARKIIDAADIGSEDLVLEVGPGTGALTGMIAEKAGQVVAVEIDKKLIPTLEGNISAYPNVDIINEDILKFDFIKILSLEYPQFESYKVVANLPYYITTPVIINFLESEKPPGLMVLMMQREVADRIMAKPGGGDYGSLSVFCQYYCEIDKVMNVSPGCFFPKPDVTSSVLKMSARVNKKLNAANEAMFFGVVRSSFAQRRKKVSNSIANTSGLGVSRQEIEEILTGLGLKKDIRAERLTIADFKRLSLEIGKIVK